MTTFHAPLAMLPHGGIIRRPNLTAGEHQAALAGIAVIEDDGQRRAEATAYGARAHDAQNTQLKATAAQVLVTLGVAEDMVRTAINGHRLDLSTNDSSKAVISRDTAVKRPWTAIIMAILSTVLVVVLFMGSESSLLGKIVMTSGVLGLLPDDQADNFLATTFAGFAIMIAFLKYGRHVALKTSAERDDNFKKMSSRVLKIGFPIWIVAFVFLFGPNLIAGGGLAEDPFAARPAWAEALTGFIFEIQKIMQALTPIFATVLVFTIVYSASDLVAGIWISHRETADRACREDVRMSERHAFHASAAEGLVADQIQTDGTIGRLKGLIDEIAADREAFADQVLHTVEALRLQGEMARRTAIIQATTGRGQVIEAGSLFTRH